jgi:hypothetical protein
MNLDNWQIAGVVLLVVTWAVAALSYANIGPWANTPLWEGAVVVGICSFVSVLAMWPEKEKLEEQNNREVS